MRSVFLAFVLLAAPLFDRESGAAAASPARPEGGASASGVQAAPVKRLARRRRKARAPVRALARLVRSGFHLTSRGSEVVLQTSAEVELETRAAKAGPTFLLKRCHATRANDRRSLDTRFFGTSVTEVALRQRGGDLEVRVRLKDPATATTRKEQGPGDTWSWILEFADPPGRGRAPAAPKAPRPSDLPTASADPGKSPKGGVATPSVVD